MSLYTTSKTRCQINTRKRREAIHLAIRKSQGSPAERVHFRLRLMYVQATPVRTHDSCNGHSCALTFTRCAFAFLVRSLATTNPAWFLYYRNFRWLKIDSRVYRRNGSIDTILWSTKCKPSSVIFLPLFLFFIFIFNFFLLILCFPFLHPYPATFFQWNFTGPIITVRSRICVILLRRSCTYGTHAIEDRERILGIRRISRNGQEKEKGRNE